MVGHLSLTICYVGGGGGGTDSEFAFLNGINGIDPTVILRCFKWRKVHKCLVFTYFIQGELIQSIDHRKECRGYFSSC